MKEYLAYLAYLAYAPASAAFLFWIRTPEHPNTIVLQGTVVPLYGTVLFSIFVHGHRSQFDISPVARCTCDCQAHDSVRPNQRCRRFLVQRCPRCHGVTYDRQHNNGNKATQMKPTEVDSRKLCQRVLHFKHEAVDPLHQSTTLKTRFGIEDLDFWQ